MPDPLILGGVAVLIALAVAAIFLPKQRKWLLGGGGVVLAGILVRVLDLVLRRKPADPMPPKVTRKDRREESGRNADAVDAASGAQDEARVAAPARPDPPTLTDLERRARESALRRRNRAGPPDPPDDA
jgi:hypothetical protein